MNDLDGIMTSTAAPVYGTCFGGSGFFILHFFVRMFKQPELAILPCRAGDASGHGRHRWSITIVIQGLREKERVVWVLFCVFVFFSTKIGFLCFLLSH